jgi:hypothetical protein
MKKRLGEILLERGLIDQEQLTEALAHQRQWGVRLGAALVAKGHVAEGTLTRILADALAFPMVDLSRVAIEPRALALVPRHICEQDDVLPLALKEQPSGRRVLLLAMADPLNATVIDEIGFTTECIVKPAIAPMSSLHQAIRRFHHGVDLEIAPLDFSPEPTTVLGEHEPTAATTTTTVGEVDVDDGDVVDVVASPLSPPRAALPEDYSGQRTGVFAMPPVVDLPRTMTPVVTGRALSGDGGAVVQIAELERLEAIERKFWALMRVLVRRGLVDRDEFLAELRQSENA